MVRALVAALPPDARPPEHRRRRAIDRPRTVHASRRRPATRIDGARGRRSPRRHTRRRDAARSRRGAGAAVRRDSVRVGRRRSRSRFARDAGRASAERIGLRRAARRSTPAFSPRRGCRRSGRTARPTDRVLMRDVRRRRARSARARAHRTPSWSTRSLAALAPLLGIDGDPLFTRVYRLERANAQHEVGHLDRHGRDRARARAPSRPVPHRQRFPRRRHSRLRRRRARATSTAGCSRMALDAGLLSRDTPRDCAITPPLAPCSAIRSCVRRSPRTRRRAQAPRPPPTSPLLARDQGRRHRSARRLRGGRPLPARDGRRERREARARDRRRATATARSGSGSACARRAAI